MRQDSFDGMVAFLTVAQLQGFSAAAARLGMSPSAVSQAVRQLERRLGVTLFNRTTRSVSLTAEGERYLERISPAIHVLKHAADDLSDQAGAPSGRLRLSLSHTAFVSVVRPVLSRFLRAYPQIRLELALDNSRVDIVATGFDAGLRFAHQVERDMVGIPVGPRLAAYVVASPQYLDRRGEPRHPRELLGHDCIVFRHLGSGMVDRWEFAKDGKSLALAIEGQLIINDATALIHTALDGVGIAYAQDCCVESLIAQGRLRRILADWSPAPLGLTLYYPDRRRVSRTLRALIEFLQAER